LSYLTIAVALLLGIASGLLAAAETAVLLLSQGRIHRLVESERPGAAALDRLADQRHRVRSSAALMAGLSAGAAAIAASELAFTLVHGSVVLGNAIAVATSVLAVGLVYSLAQALPRTLAASNPERIGLETARFAVPLVAALGPVTRLLDGPWEWGVSVASDEDAVPAWASAPEDRSAESPEDAVREETEDALLEAVSDFAEKVVREVMIPRTDVAALPETATIAEAVDLLFETGYSRVPVYYESVDDIRGVLYAKDLLVAMSGENPAQSVGDIARSPYFVPETKPVEELLREMRKSTHMAIVADEYGGTAGIVTLEDLLEEIVGEISDEYDREEPLIVDLGGGTYRVDAMLPIDELNDRFGTDIDMDADSVGGLFTEVAGRIPVEGESVEVEGLRLTVTDLEGTRLRALTVEPIGPSAADEGEHDA
jgi:CBS domain containing-hemolysin-like protein